MNLVIYRLRGGGKKKPRERSGVFLCVAIIPAFRFARFTAVEFSSRREYNLGLLFLRLAPGDCVIFISADVYWEEKLNRKKQKLHRGSEGVEKAQGHFGTS
jgi:hypothetical protein